MAAAESVAQCPDGTPPPCAGRPAASSPTSVAVLPFANLSRDSSDAYLAEGLTEELISRLGAVPRLRVPGRSVVRHAQAVAADPQALARRLGVRYLVEGSVRRGGTRLRVSVRLLRAADEAAPSADFARGILATFPAIGRIALGDREGAIAMLQTIPPSVIYSWILRYPQFDPIRADPRFQRIEAAARAAP